LLFVVVVQRMDDSVQVQYLGTDQFRLGGTNACSWCAVYAAMYLCYSPSPRPADLAEHMRRACSDWKRTRRLAAMQQDAPSTAHAANRATRILLEAREDWFGVNVPPSMTRADLPPGMLAPEFQLDQFPFLVGLGELVKRLVAAARALPTPEGVSALAATFSSRGSTLGIGVRREEAGGRLRFDVVDSHEQFVSGEGQPPQDGRPQAFWASTSSPLSLLALLSELYPPSGDLSGVEHLKLADQASGARVPRNHFSVTLFAPRFARAPASLAELDAWDAAAKEAERQNRERVIQMQKKQQQDAADDKDRSHEMRHVEDVY
jgi:hypothetical protein